MIDDREFQFLREKAFQIRKLTIREIAELGSGHIGGSMSIVELLSYLYFHEMRVDPKDPAREDRDRAVFSKGHAGPAVYATLALKGYFPEEWLNTLNKDGTNLPSHCDMNKTPGVDFTTGSLGQGASAAVGIALGQKIKKQDAYTYLVIGDGESQEGQVWEAAITAPNFDLGNLIAFTDYNKLQLDGYTYDIINVDDLNTKWAGFGWHVQRIDGHDLRAIARAVGIAKSVKDRPSMIIMDTLKSKGFAPGEGISACHSMAFSKEVAEEAIAELERQYAAGGER